MKPYSKSLLTTSLLASASWASAQIVTKCPSSDVCYKLNIPQNTASSGSGDIFFQITAPSNYEWVALGQGKGMTGANMFLIYTNSGGSNVTLSPRTANGHNQPNFNSNANVQLLDGSGVSNGVMTANIKCSSCSNWGSGSMDFTSGNGGWLYAYQSSGGPKNSDDTNAGISQHSNKATFTWDFSTAKGGDDVNPFTSSSSDPSNTSPGTLNPTQPSSGNSQGNSSDDSDDNANSERMMQIAHGIMACLAFVVLFPSGAILMRLASFPGLVWVHAAFQIFSWLVFFAAFGLGVHIANEQKMLNDYHPIIGIVVFVLIFFQPILGYMHHIFFKKHQRRTVWSHGHLWLGRIVITLGIINGGLGLKFANDSSTGARIGYAVVAAIMWLAWVGATGFGERRRTQKLSEVSKYNNLPGSSHAQHNGTEMPVLNNQSARKGDA